VAEQIKVTSREVRIFLPEISYGNFRHANAYISSNVPHATQFVDLFSLTARFSPIMSRL